jgi:enterochelin esterase-like enzyme
VAPVVDSRGVTFLVADAGRELHGVRLWQELGLPADTLEFGRDGDRWSLRIDRPAVDRMEYLLELAHPGGTRELRTDPGNPLTAGGAFGHKSAGEFAEYAPPRWLDAPAPPGTTKEFAVDSRHLRAQVHGRIWSPAGLAPETPAPLLVVHDGPEYDRLARLTRFLAGANAPPLRALLLDPGERNRWYSASDAYARALHDEVLPPVPATRRIGMGTSLGALAMLHAHHHDPSAFAGLFLQSGSFFTARLDPQEREFPGFGAVTEFVARDIEAPGPTVMTCGLVEENLANNRLMARRLGAELHGVRDAHNYTGWRDAFDPYLTALLRRVLT